MKYAREIGNLCGRYGKVYGNCGYIGEGYLLGRLHIEVIHYLASLHPLVS